MRRPSLLLRFFGISVVIAAFAIAVTAWLASQTTADNIQQQTGHDFDQDARLYDQLLGYAATHNNWAGVRPTLDALAEQSGRRLALTTADRAPIADTAAGDAPPLPLQRDAVVDPLHVDPTLQHDAPATRVDRRAVAALAPLPAADRARLRTLATELLSCLRGSLDADGRLAFAPNGRPTVVLPSTAPAYEADQCLTGPAATALSTPTAAERSANATMRAGETACRDRSSASPSPSPSPSPTPSPSASTRPSPSASSASATPSSAEPTTYPAAPGATPSSGNGYAESLMPTQFWTYEEALSGDPSIADCFAGALREQLGKRVAPPALLFLTAPHGPAPATADLSRAGTVRIALTAGVVLAVAAFAAWLGAAQLTRPLRAVTTAAHRMAGGDRSVRVASRARGELGELASAFNTMSERLERTEQQRQALISDVAHELRNPLGNITGWLEATHDGLATADPELIELLLNESLLLQYLVNDLQDLAQADAGNLRLHPELTDAGDLVDQVTAAHQAAADERKVTLRAMARGRISLVADPARLRQALGNLVSNAVRYTPAGGEVTVMARRLPDGVLFEVADTGCGIAADELPRVFDRFWRSDTSRSRRTGGSGLGLAIAKYLCEAHGGTISATSVVSSGSTFRMVLPEAPPPVRPDVSSPPP